MQGPFTLASRNAHVEPTCQSVRRRRKRSILTPPRQQSTSCGEHSENRGSVTLPVGSGCPIRAAALSQRTSRPRSIGVSALNRRLRYSLFVEREPADSSAASTLPVKPASSTRLPLPRLRHIEIHRHVKFASQSANSEALVGRESWPGFVRWTGPIIVAKSWGDVEGEWPCPAADSRSPTSRRRSAGKKFRGCKCIPIL